MWDASKPATGIQARYVDDQVRENNAAVEDALARDHEFPGTLGSTAGMHNVVQLIDQAGDEAAHATAVKIWNNAGALRYIAPGGSAGNLGLEGVLNAPTGTVMVFGQNSAPTGWTRKADWQDNAMLCYAASGNIGSGGAVNPQSAHTHTGPSHAHTGPEHAHTGPSHVHTGPSHAHTGPSHNHQWHDYVAGSPSRSYDSGGSAGNLSGGVGAFGYNILVGTGDGISTFVLAADYYTTAAGTGVTSSAGTGDTGASGTGSTSLAGTGVTSSAGTGATGSNSTPHFQEVIVATKD